MPLELAAKDRRQLKAMMTGGAQMTSRRWRRIRTLLLLADGLSARATAEAVGTHPREARRVGHRYRAGGLEAALGEDAQPPPPKLLTARSKQRSSRWSAVHRQRVGRGGPCDSSPSRR